MYLIGRTSILVLATCFAATVTGCMNKYDSNSSSAQTGGEHQSLRHPYVASQKRQNQIVGAYRQVRVGMSEKDVIALLGEPDEKNATYEAKIINPRQIGLSYVYVVQRLKECGSVDAMQEEVVRIQFDDLGLVVRVIPVGLAPDDTGAKEQER